MVRAQRVGFVVGALAACAALGCGSSGDGGDAPGGGGGAGGDASIATDSPTEATADAVVDVVSEDGADLGPGCYNLSDGHGGAVQCQCLSDVTAATKASFPDATCKVPSGGRCCVSATSATLHAVACTCLGGDDAGAADCTSVKATLTGDATYSNVKDVTSCP